MFGFLKRRVLNNRGATENIVVMLLLVIIGVGALIAFSDWTETETQTLKETTSTKIEATVNDASGN